MQGSAITAASFLDAVFGDEAGPVSLRSLSQRRDGRNNRELRQILFAPITLDFVLPGSTNTYLNLLAQSLEQQDDLPFKTRIRVHRIESFF